MTRLNMISVCLCIYFCFTVDLFQNVVSCLPRQHFVIIIGMLEMLYEFQMVRKFGVSKSF